MTPTYSEFPVEAHVQPVASSMGAMQTTFAPVTTSFATPDAVAYHPSLPSSTTHSPRERFDFNGLASPNVSTPDVSSYLLASQYSTQDALRDLSSPVFSQFPLSLSDNAFQQSPAAVSFEEMAFSSLPTASSGMTTSADVLQTTQAAFLTPPVSSEQLPTSNPFEMEAIRPADSLPMLQPTATTYEPPNAAFLTLPMNRDMNQSSISLPALDTMPPPDSINLLKTRNHSQPSLAERRRRAGPSTLAVNNGMNVRSGSYTAGMPLTPRSPGFVDQTLRKVRSNGNGGGRVQKPGTPGFVSPGLNAHFANQLWFPSDTPPPSAPPLDESFAAVPSLEVPAPQYDTIQWTAPYSAPPTQQTFGIAGPDRRRSPSNDRSPKNS